MIKAEIYFYLTIWLIRPGHKLVMVAISAYAQYSSSFGYFGWSGEAFFSAEQPDDEYFVFLAGLSGIWYRHAPNPMRKEEN